MAKRKSQLVCQYLENVSRRMLEKYQDVIRGFVRKRNGVYALYRRASLYYVGLASSLLGRLKGHLRGRHGSTWDRFSVYLTLGPQHMKEIESLLLRISSPPGNKVKGKFANCENLLRKVKAEYRQRQRQEEEELFGSRGGVGAGPEVRKRYPRGPKGRVPVLARWAGEVKKLRAYVRGKRVEARVLRHGQISMNRRRYNSPSKAGAVACRRGCNGWRFWRYERAPGDWVLLRELRS